MASAINKSIKETSKGLEISIAGIKLGDGSGGGGWAPKGAYAAEFSDAEIVPKKGGGYNVKGKVTISDHPEHPNQAGVSMTVWHPVQTATDDSAKFLGRLMLSRYSADGQDAPDKEVLKLKLEKLNGPCFVLLDDEQSDKGVTFSTVATYLSKEGFESSPGPRDPDAERPQPSKGGKKSSVVIYDDDNDDMGLTEEDKAPAKAAEKAESEDDDFDWDD